MIFMMMMIMMIMIMMTINIISIFLNISNLCAIHAKRVTLMQKDIQLARRIRGPWGGLG